MALFKGKKELLKEIDELPPLPELPKLPEIPSMPKNNAQANVQFKPNILPRFPPNAIGNKFSQNTIKNAIAGEKESDMEKDEVNESEEIQTMPKLPKGPLAREMPEEEEFDEEMPPMHSMPRQMNDFRKKEEPMFVRLDRFEESLENFEKIKKQLAGVEGLLEEIKKTKEDEGRELADWQARLQTMKNQIDKIDQDIFSKIE
ncbi:MAG TPA: hypothetical protein VMC07_02505 [Candidatus Omnitrophota bacterium]|nr:hypothetical protein [Candidatus Omnitrophota bacterium]